MCGGNEELTLKQQKQEELRLEVHQQLNVQQSWDLQEGQSITQRRDVEAMTLITRQIGINETLSAQVQQKYASVPAKSAAEGTPEQTMKPAKKSWKERQEEKKRKKAQTKEMQQHTPVGDHITYAFAKAMEEIDAERANSLSNEIKSAVSAMHTRSADQRVMTNFVNGYRKNARGEPLNEEERQKKEQDEAFIQDYLASAHGSVHGDPLELRRPHLRRFTNNLLNVELSEGMFTEEYMYEHAAELKKLSGQFTYFDNLMEDPINARFFTQELSPFEKDWLNACRDSVMAFRMLVPAQMTIHGVQESSAQPYISEPSILKSMNENCKVLSEEYKQRLKTDRVKQQKAASDEVERLRAQLRETDVQPLQDTAGLQSMRELFLSEPEKYAKHKTKLDQLYQQYYRAVDTLRQLTNDGAAYGQIVEQYRESTDIHRHLAQTAYQKQMEAEAQCQLIRQQMEAMSDLMGYYLGGSLTQAAQAQEEEGRRKVAERLDNITFTENPLPLQGLEPVEATSIYTSYKRAGIEKNTPETERLELKDTLLNSDMAPHLENSLENASGVKFSGLVGMRLATTLTGAAGHGYSIEDLLPLFQKLSCCGEYNMLKLRAAAGTITDEERRTLENYDVEYVNRVFAAGIREVKHIYLDHLRRLQSKYGTLSSQLHPEDFLARVGPEYFDDMQLDQDVLQLFAFGDGHPEFAIPEDEELRMLNDYYHSTVMIINGYYMSNMWDDVGKETYYDSVDHKTAAQLEKKIQGPGLSPLEEEYYHQNLKQQSALRLFGRFTLGADDAAEEPAEQEIVYEAIQEEIAVEVNEAVKEEIFHEAVLEEVREEPQQDTRTAQQRMEARMKTLSFTPAPERTARQRVNEFYFEYYQSPSAQTTLETGRETLSEDFKARFSDENRYGNGYGSSFKNIDGKDIRGLQSTRLTALLVGSLGHGQSIEDLAEMYEELLSCARYNQLKQQETNQTIQPKEAAELAELEEKREELNSTFHKGVLKLKDLQMQHLERLVEKYGRFGGQLHPEDFLAKVGPEFFDDFALLQDVGDTIDYLHSIKIQDKRFEQLAAYFSAVYNTVDKFMTAKYKDKSAKGMEEYEQIQSHRILRDLEQVIGGDGFSAEELAAYEEQVRQRAEAGESIDVFGRFKTQEQRDAQARAKAQALAEQLATAHIRTRQEAVNTHSDQLSVAKRMGARGLAFQFKKNDPVRLALESYYDGPRYKVGYTEERRILKVVINEVEKAWNALTKDEQQDEGNTTAQLLKKVKAYFAEITNGTLQVPEGAQVQDFSHQQPTEQGTIERGAKRNALIRGFSYWSNQKDTPLFSHEPTVNDLKQRMVSNCYMVAGTAGLVNIDPALLKECIRDNLDGTVTVRLFEKYVTEEEKQLEVDSKAAIQAELDALQQKVELGEVDEWDVDALEFEIKAKQYVAKQSYRPIYVKVSKEIPRMVGGADALSAGALWMQMIEKACAFVGRDAVKGYKSLWYGEGGGFLERLLGVEPEPVGTANEEQLFDDICNCLQNKVVYNAGTGGGAGKSDGLNAGHAYTVMGGKTVGNKRFVLLRNPYSTMSLQQLEDGTKTRTGKHLDTHSDETYGQFYMEFEEFLQKFRNLTRIDLNKVQRNPGAT